MKKLFMTLIGILLLSPLVMAQDTVYVKTFDDLGDALEQKLAPLEQLKELPHDNCKCEECMVIKNKVADEVDKIYIDTSQLVLNPWQSRSFHNKINSGVKNIENLNKIGEKIRTGECLQRRHTHHKSPHGEKQMEN
jgi:hypothetical protein